MAVESSVPKWISAIVAVLILLGSGATAYSSLSSKMTALEVENERLKEDYRKLDEYDVHLEGEIDKLKGDAIRMEAEMGSVKAATSKMEFTMSEMLKEMKRMNENIIRMGVANGKDG